MHATGIGRFATALLIVSLTAGASAQTQVKRGFNMFSKDQDVEVGRKAAAETESELPVLSDAEITAYVNNLGMRLASVSQGPKFPYSFKVVDVADINAFALPGGPIYVHRGTIEAARNDGELAGVLAHEISHVALRHGTHEISKAMRAQLLVGLAAGAIGGDVENIINQVGGFGLQALFLKYSRSAETEADVVGVQTLVKAGIDPADMIGFFDTLEKQDKNRTAEWMSSHPTPAHRVERIKQEANLMKVPVRSGAAPAPSDRFRRVQERLRRMPPARTLEEIKKGQSAHGGATGPTGPAGSPGPTTPSRMPPPSSRLGSYASRDGAFRVSAPSDWRIAEETSSSATLAPEGGVRQVRGATEVVWGAMLGRHAGRSRTATIEGTTDDLVSGLLSGSPYLRVVAGSRRAFRDEAGDGRRLTLEGTNDLTGAERVEVVTRWLGRGEVAYMLFVTPAEAPREWRDALTRMVPTFRTGQ